MTRVQPIDGPNIVYDHGVHLLGSILWFDPDKVREFCAISNARVPHSDRQQKVLWGDRTARLDGLHHGRKARGLVCPFNRPFSLGPLKIELFPSGYMAGASQFEVTLASGHKLVYTGPFSQQPTRTAETIEIRRCDTLVLDATYGNPQFKFPPRDDVYNELLAWTDETLASGATPIFLVANPGKAQDLVHLLGGRGFEMRVHRSIADYNRAYRGIGVDVPKCKQFSGWPTRTEVVIWPSHLKKSPAIRNLRKTRFASMSGLAVLPNAQRRLSAPTVFTWSARSDHDEVLAYVEKARPKQVITTGRHAVDLAKEVTERLRVKAWPLHPSPQMPLL